MTYARQYANKTEAQQVAADMRSTHWPSARIISSWVLNDGPICEGDDERWLISVGDGGWLLDDDRIGRQPSA